MLATASGKLRALNELRTSVALAKSLTMKQKIALGGVGALTPILLNLAVVDAPTLSNVTLAVIAGYVLKVVILFYVGGMTAALHRKEEDPIRIFELGIVAPALLTTLINGAYREKHNYESPSQPAAVSDALKWLLPSELVAAETTNQPRTVYSFHQAPPEPLAQQFLRGLVGQTTTRGPWFVCIRPTELGLAAAEAMVNDLRSRYDVSARIYHADGGPSSRPGAYTVVVADWTNDATARAIGQNLRDKGVPNVFEWMRPSP